MYQSQDDFGGGPWCIISQHADKGSVLKEPLLNFER